MSAYLLTAPAVEPLSLADAKLFLRVAHSDDDVLIASLIAAARSHIEAQTRRALITQTWRVVRDTWPADGRIGELPAPVQSVAAARVYDVDNVATGLDPSVFVIDNANDRIAAPAWALPAPGRATAGIEVDVVAGFGDAAVDVPAELVQAMRFLIGHWYDNRGNISPGQSVMDLPQSVRRLIAPWRRVGL